MASPDGLAKWQAMGGSIVETPRSSKGRVDRAYVSAKGMLVGRACGYRPTALDDVDHGFARAGQRFRSWKEAQAYMDGEDTQDQDGKADAALMLRVADPSTPLSSLPLNCHATADPHHKPAHAAAVKKRLQDAAPADSGEKENTHKSKKPRGEPKARKVAIKDDVTEKPSKKVEAADDLDKDTGGEARNVGSGRRAAQGVNYKDETGGRVSKADLLEVRATSPASMLAACCASAGLGTRNPGVYIHAALN